MHKRRWHYWGMAALAMAMLVGCAFPPPNPPMASTKPVQEQVTEPVSDDSAQPVALPTVTPTPATFSGLTPKQAALLARLPSRGVAPELSNETWLNSEPLTLAELRGKVVMVEFWTFGCINCQHVIPYTQEWYAKYKDQGFEIVGVHTPEFAYEEDVNNVQAAVARLGVTWPVAIDNEKITWRAYANHYWPAAYLVDKQGNIRLLTIGEGHYEYTESVIQALLAE